MVYAHTRKKSNINFNFGFNNWILDDSLIIES